MNRTGIAILASLSLLAPASLQVQSQQANQLYESLRNKLANAKSDLDSLKFKMEGRAQQADQEVRSRLDQLQQQIEQDRNKVSAA